MSSPADLREQADAYEREALFGVPTGDILALMRVVAALRQRADEIEKRDREVAALRGWMKR